MMTGFTFADIPTAVMLLVFVAGLLKGLDWLGKRDPVKQEDFREN